MLQIQLGPERPIDPSTDPLSRTHVGARSGMSEQDAWLAGRGIWKFNANRALAEEEVQIVDTDGTILAVAEITGITKWRNSDRFAIEGRLLLGDTRVGQPTTTPHPSRNPVAYI